MPPRKRSAPPSDDQPIPVRPKVEHTFSPLFDNKENDADLILVSSSDPPVSFAVRRIALELHSSALSFAYVKAEGSSSKKKDKDIEIVNIEAESKALEIFLRYLVPKSYLDLDGVAPKFHPFLSTTDVDLLATVLELATRYQCPSILDVISKQHLPLLYKTHPLEGWALSCRFGRLEEAREAIRSLANAREIHPGAKRYNSSQRRIEKDWRDKGLGDMVAKYLEGVPATAIVSFAAVQTKVVASTPGYYTWEKAAGEFAL